jgi:hypothetical protein
MTRSVVEPAFSGGKPKKLLDQMPNIARESPAFVWQLRDYGVASSE